MSPRAACRLESLGFADVYDYVAGRTDWSAAGLAIEGSSAGQPTLGSVARTDAPNCGLEERIGAVRDRVSAAGWATCMVTDAAGIVLGRLFGKELALAEDSIAGEVMRAGPSTYRPDVPVEELLEKLRPKQVHRALVATPEGRLLGVFFTGDAAPRRS